jgi:hypothetical protein
MIVLYIILGILLFLLLFIAFVLFIPLRSYIKGTYWDKKPTGQMEVYWIKYFLGVRLRIKDIEQLHILIWFLGIPIPLKMPLKKVEQKEQKEEAEQKTENSLDEEHDPIRIEEEETGPDKKFSQKLKDILDAKDNVKTLWLKYQAYIQKIFVSYITFSVDYIDTEIGFSDPSQTGMAAGIVYSALSLRPLDNIKVSWDYTKPNFNVSSGIKMTMNLYGIFRTLLSLYLRYKKERKNDIQ